MNTQEDRLRRLIRDTVHETLANLGFDVCDQGRIQADMHYLRRLREGGEDMSRKVRTTLIGAGVSGLLYLVWTALEQIARGR